MSSNELQSLPVELCSLRNLRDLNVRRNQLSTLPDGKEDETRRMDELVCAFISEAAVPEIHRWGLLTRCPLTFPHLVQVAMWSSGVLGPSVDTNRLLISQRVERAPGVSGLYFIRTLILSGLCPLNLNCHPEAPLSSINHFEGYDFNI